MTSHRTNILAIESAILGGSVAILAANGSMRSSLGTTGVSRAEDLLINVNSLLEECAIKTTDIGSIIVSAGPGSFTGIRIGVATGKGLATALDIELRSVSLLASMACVSGVIGEVAACVPVGRGMFCVEVFEVKENEITTMVAAEPIASSELQSWLISNDIKHLVGVREHFADSVNFTEIQFTDVAPCLAEVILAGSAESRINSDVAPIFISKSTRV